jgi:putative transposase
MELLTRKTFKYRIYPTKSQVSTLENQFSMCGHLYNWNLAERIEAYQKDGTTISYNQQQNKPPALKEERPRFKSVHSQVLQDALRRLDNGYQSFFRRINNGETPGFPKFKKGTKQCFLNL